MSARRVSLLAPLACLMGVASFSIMDATMKMLSLGIGVYSALLLRGLTGTLITGTALVARSGLRLPPPKVLRLHILRGLVMTVMGWLFFLSLTLLPLAEAISLSFIAPLVALFLAAWLLKETIPPTAILSAILGLVGVGIVLSGRLSSTYGQEAIIGAAAILSSAVLFGYSLVLQRQVAQQAPPVEMSFWQNFVTFVALAPLAFFFLHLPEGTEWGWVVISTLLVVNSQICLGWAYARAPASRLVPLEYSAFLWASLFGWLFFQEKLTMTVVLGAAVIVAACLIATQSATKAEGKA
ncbi:MAG: DMT family transporter [Sphingobium sp.]|nr:DMT family transporter [Sphingobium sp.]